MASIIAIGILALVVALCFVALHREDQVAQAKLLLDRQLSWGDSRPVNRFRLLSGEVPPRAELTHALYLARGVAPLDDSKNKQRILDIAQLEVDDAIASRPHWGEAWVVRAFIAYGRDNKVSPAMLADLARSYMAGPLQRDAGPWRVRMALANWDAFDPAVQERIVAETVWLLQVSPPASRRVLFDLARNSPFPAYERIFLRWRLFQLHERGLAG